MPKSTREWAHRKLDQSRGSMNWAAIHLSEVVEVYQKDHDEIAEPLRVAIDMLIEVDKLIAKVKETF